MKHRSEQIEAALEQLARLHRLVELQLELHRLGRGFFFDPTFFFQLTWGEVDGAGEIFATEAECELGADVSPGCTGDIVSWK